MDNSSNASSPTNGIVGNTIFTDKPDELASTGNIQPQLQSLLQLHPNLLPTFHLSPQQKKCLHRRILMQSQTLPSTLPTTFTPSIQRAFPVQQPPIHLQPPPQQQMQQHAPPPPPQQQQQQQPPQQRLPPLRMTPSPTALNANGNSPSSVINANAATVAASAIISAAGSNNVNMINANNTVNSAMSNGGGGPVNNGNASSNTIPIIHNQNGLVQQLNAALLAERYLLMDLVEGSTLYKCIDVKTHEELVCKVRIFIYKFTKLFSLCWQITINAIVRFSSTFNHIFIF